MSSLDDARLPSRSTRPAGRRSWLAPLGLAGVVLSGCALVALSDEAAGLVPACPFRAVTGLDCPLCGGTRAVRALGTGQLVQAAGYNVLLVAAVPLLLLAWGRWLARELGRADPSRCSPPWLLPLAAGVVAAFAVARNLDVAGLAWLASGP